MKKLYITFIALFFSALVFFGAYIFFAPKIKFSNNENRYLADLPSLSAQNVLYGDFQKSLSNFMSDRFICRDMLMSFSTELRKAEGKKDFGGVYKGKDGYYFKKICDEDIDYIGFKNNLKYINNFAESLKNPVTVLLVPSSSTINEKYLPEFAKCYNANNLFTAAKKKLTNCKLCDIRKALNGSKKQCYYKTDHHWTAAGANIGYNMLCKAFKIKSVSVENTLASNNFLGTLYSDTLDSSATFDKVYLPKVKNLSVTADGNATVMFHLNELNSKDKYKVFFGGNYGLVTIKTNCKSDKKLVVFKDSFANSIVPYLTNNYSEITMIDYRFFAGSASNFTKARNTDILFLYELSNFADDKDLIKLQIFN